jgi:cobalt/nickel transport system permease protein
MSLRLTRPVDFHSPLARFDPRWKLVSLLTATIVAALLRTLPASAIAFAATLLLALLARLPVRWLAMRLGSVSIFLLFFVVWLPFVHGDPSWELGPLRLSNVGTVQALVLWLKALAIVTLMLVLWASSPLGATLKAAQALRVPGLAIHLVLLTYRYLFLLADELARLRIALRVRGYRPRGNVHSYRTLGRVSGVLLVRSQERAERVAQAMRCRGFDGRFRALTDFRSCWRDVVAALLIVTAATALLCGDWFWQ